MEEEDLTFRIRGCIHEVSKVLGGGFLEQVYHNALLVGSYIADILVEDRVVIELKAVESLSKAHEAQLLNYLRASGKKVGLLVNFTYPKAEIRRFVV